MWPFTRSRESLEEKLIRKEAELFCFWKLQQLGEADYLSVTAKAIEVSGEVALLQHKLSKLKP